LEGSNRNDLRFSSNETELSDGEDEDNTGLDPAQLGSIEKSILDKLTASEFEYSRRPDEDDESTSASQNSTPRQGD
jgi:hypothetical protein